MPDDHLDETPRGPFVVDAGELDVAYTQASETHLVARGGDPHRWVILVAALCGAFATGLTITVLTTALPFIGRDFEGTADATLSWIVIAPFLFRAIFVPTFGKLGDKFGRKAVWVGGFGISTAASLACGFAPNVASLIGLRAIAAAGAAAVIPTSLALIATAFAPEDRVRALGWWSATIAGAPLLGVVLGGFVVEGWGWRFLFFAQFPISLAGLLLGIAVLRESRGRGDERFDLAGSFASIVGLGALMLVLNQGSEWGWSSPAVIIGAIVAVTLLVAFVEIERRAAAPLVPLHYFRDRSYRSSVAAAFFANFAYMGGFFVTSLMLVDRFDWSAAQVALGVSPRAAALGVMGPIAGYLAARLGGRRSTVGGLILLVISMVLLAFVGDTFAYWRDMFPALVLSGFGLGLVGPPTAAEVTNVARSSDLAAASGSLNLGASVGSSLGIAAMAAVVTSVGSAGTGRPYVWSFAVGAVVVSVGAVVALGMRGRSAVDVG